MRNSGASGARRVSRLHQGQARVEVWLEAVRYEGLPRGQLGHIQVPQGTLEAGDCDRGAN